MLEFHLLAFEYSHFLLRNKYQDQFSTCAIYLLLALLKVKIKQAFIYTQMKMVWLRVIISFKKVRMLLTQNKGLFSIEVDEYLLNDDM